MELTTLKPHAIVIGKDIEKYIPHRFENVLLDKVEAFAENPDKLLAIFELTIAEKDAHGRELFLVKDQNGVMIYNGYMFPEAMALAALTYCNTVLGTGYIALFSTISNVQITGAIKAGEKMTGAVYLKRGKGAFNTFSGKTFNGKGEIVAENDIMAFVVKASDTPPAGGGEKKKAEIPVKTMEQAIDFTRIASKDARMFFAKTVVAYDKDARSIVTAFTYPKDHPLVKGHFPGNPIMMGICQWMASGDTLDALGLKLLDDGVLSDGATITGDVELIKDDGTLITEITGISRSYSVSGKNIRPVLVSTKKCGFRDMIQPGTNVLLRVTNAVIS